MWYFYTQAIRFCFHSFFSLLPPPTPIFPLVCLLSVPKNLLFGFCATLSSLFPTFKRFHPLALKIPIFQAILSRKTHAGGFSIPDFKLCTRAIANKTKQMVLAQKQTRADGVTPRISPHSHTATRAFTKTPGYAHSQTVLGKRDRYV